MARAQQSDGFPEPSNDRDFKQFSSMVVFVFFFSLIYFCFSSFI